MIFGCDLTKIYHFKSTEILSKLRRFNVRRGFLEIVFPPKFQNCFYKCVVIIASYQLHTKFQTLQRAKLIPTFARVLVCRSHEESRDRLTHFRQREHRENPAVKKEDSSMLLVSPWLYRHHIIRSSEMF